MNVTATSTLPVNEHPQQPGPQQSAYDNNNEPRPQRQRRERTNWYVAEHTKQS